MREDVIEVGRPHGGLAIMVKKVLKNNIAYIGSSPDNKCKVLKLL